MANQRVYVEDECLPNSEITLSPIASHHLIKSLRSKVKDKIILFNGTEFEYSAEIISISRRDVVVCVLQQHKCNSESLLKVNLFQAISRGDRMDYAIQKAVECGVSTITPTITERTHVKLSDERALKRVAHWQAIALHAAQQSGRLMVPKIQAVQSFADIVWNNDQVHFIAHLDFVSLPSEHMIEDECALIIGPEGGFSADEISAAKKNKFKGINLGPRILRTETAPVVALTLLQSRWGDLQ